MQSWNLLKSEFLKLLDHRTFLPSKKTDRILLIILFICFTATSTIMFKIPYQHLFINIYTAVKRWRMRNAEIESSDDVTCESDESGGHPP